MSTNGSPIPRNPATDALEAIEHLFASCHPDMAHKVQRYLGEYIDAWVTLIDAQDTLIALATAGRERQQDADAMYEAGLHDGLQRAKRELEQTAG